MCILILFTLNFCYKYAESLPKYSYEVNQTLFGNLKTSVQDLLRDAKYTLEWDGKVNPKDFVDPDTNINFKDEVNFVEPDEFVVNEGSQDHADQMYVKLSKEANAMRRTFWFDPVDVDDLDHGLYGIENWKQHIIRRNFLQFIIHTRYEVGKALRQREPIRSDRRYQIGYLFNRLRRIKTEQLKLLYYLHNKMRHRTKPWGHWFRYYHVYFVKDPFLNHLMIYEKLTAFDVDIKDTINYIKEIFVKKESYDYIDVAPVTENKTLTVRPPDTTPQGATMPNQEGLLSSPLGHLPNPHGR